jgi:hypothetical protein
MDLPDTGDLNSRKSRLELWEQVNAVGTGHFFGIGCMLRFCAPIDREVKQSERTIFEGASGAT